MILAAEVLVRQMPAEPELDFRRRAVSRSSCVVGLSHVVTTRQEDGSWQLAVFFVPSASATKPGVPPGLKRTNFLLRRIDGARAGLWIESLQAPQTADGALLLTVRREWPAEGDDLYVLQLVGVPDVDPLLAEVRFSLSGALVAAPAGSPAPDLATAYAPIDYLSKDYQSFRQLMLDRMTLTFPTWRERNPTDLGIAVVEVLAYAADFLSYYQDAVGTEAYLGTARRRISVRRHARLLDYTLDDGLNARVWVAVQVTPGPPVQLPRRTGLLTRTQGLQTVVAPEQLATMNLQAWSSRIFETLEPAELRAKHNRMELYAWGIPDYALPRGATSATLKGRFPHLRSGDVLILQALSLEAGGSPAHPVRLQGEPLLTTDPLYGQKVTEIAWYDEDALPFPLPVASEWRGRVVQRAVAWGNVVAADQGETFRQELPPVPPEGDYQPILQAGLVVCAPFEPDVARRRPAAVALDQEASAALPAVTLLSQRGEIVRSWRPGDPYTEVWVSRRDLLTSGPYAREFVAEVENDGSAVLRFGDGQLGRKPAAYMRFLALFRLGGGPTGNVGAYAIHHLITADPALPARIRKVCNYTEGQGGATPESSSQAALRAPQTFREQQRCVTPEDFTARAKRFRAGEVLDAVTEIRWTGSWSTAFLYVERRGGRPVDAGFIALFRAYMEPFLLADQELAVLPPAYVPLEIVLVVTLAPHAFREAVRRELDLLLGPQGFFAPDNFRFGQPVFLSEIVTRAAGAEGVARVDTRRFQRWGEPARGELAAGCIVPGPLEIVRVENQPGVPQLGILRCDLEGGV